MAGATEVGLAARVQLPAGSEQRWRDGTLAELDEEGKQMDVGGTGGLGGTTNHHD